MLDKKIGLLLGDEEDWPQTFEALARRLVEGSFRRLSGGHMAPLELVARLSQAMEDGQEQGFAPDEYFVWLHPDDHEDDRELE